MCGNTQINTCMKQSSRKVGLFCTRALEKHISFEEKRTQHTHTHTNTHACTVVCTYTHKHASTLTNKRIQKVGLFCKRESTIRSIAMNESTWQGWRCR